jgi:hypothetical protein
LGDYNRLVMVITIHGGDIDAHDLTERRKILLRRQIPAIDERTGQLSLRTRHRADQ